MKSHRIVVKFIHTEERRDRRDEADCCFNNLAKAFKKNQHHSHHISSLNLNISQIHSVNIITNFDSTIASHPLFGLHSGCFQTHFPVEIPVPLKTRISSLLLPT